MKEVEQVEMTENLDFAPFGPYAPHVVISTAGRNLRMVKSHQKLSNDLLDIIYFSITIDRTCPLAEMVIPGMLRSLPAVMIKKRKVKMIKKGGMTFK